MKKRADTEVVKGAAGSTLYGARASQGVISIRTKRGGTQEGVKFNVRSEFGANDVEGDFGSAQFHRFTMDETGTRFCVQITGLAPCSRTVDWMTELLRVNDPPGDFSTNPVSLVGGSPAGNDVRNRYQVSRWPGRRYNPVAQTTSRQPFLLMSADMTGRIGTTSFFVSGSRQEQKGAFRGLDGTDVFALQTIDGWGFDVEVLFIARRRGYDIRELPIPWYFNADSKVRVLHDSLRMGLDLFKIRYNAWRGVYDAEV